ncbi:Crp/Fnr family transcriptional regulator [Kineobactrum salinum]|uniref:Crp/Fnr family transcriptional regulator n=1 Tax=Kineobactrum salinum TaxID=2708301 RepID=A0A6C0TXS3_9GAMM|nr:Crp/Fnr family transcriptional regulator [Kineobactrum salinum]QIB64438.1 Crp/Fnr family transcriptional regulator [Kineobactrum salinum]
MTLWEQDWIGELPVPVREEVLACMPPRRYANGETIYRAGEAGAELYRVEQGNVRIFNLSQGGKELLYDLFPPRTCFGEATLIDGGGRPHTTQAIGEVILRVMPQEHFERLWQVHPEISWAVARLQTERARRLYAFYEQVSLDTLCRRIARRLCLLARTVGQEREDGIHFDLRITQEDIGCLVAGSRQSVNKVLRQWQAERVIDLAYGSLLIRELSALEQLALPVEEPHGGTLSPR